MKYEELVRTSLEIYHHVRHSNPRVCRTWFNDLSAYESPVAQCGGASELVIGS